MDKTTSANASFYELGRCYTEQVALHVARGAEARAAPRRVAADLGRDVSAVRAALRFREAVDRIAANVGPAARELILAEHRRLTPKLVMQISRTHRDRQQFAMDQAAQGRHPFAKSRDGTDAPFDTLGYGEVRSRIARTAGSLVRVAGGLAATATEGWPPEAKLRQMADHLDHVRMCCSAVRSMLDGAEARVDIGPALALPTRARRPGRASGRPATFRPGGALGFVAAARGIAEKNGRDIPRLLRESPPTVEERDSLLELLGLLDSAATRLAEVIGWHIGRGASHDEARGWGSPGRVSIGRVTKSRGFRMVNSPRGPAALGGTYVVFFRLDADATITAGALGTFRFPAGFYSYIGSAFGPGGVRARTGRHRTPVKERPKWNIDYFTPHATPVELLWTHDPVRRECSWSSVLARTPGFDCPAPAFGARDCRNAPAPRIGGDVFRCPAHFYHSTEAPDVRDFARGLAALIPGHAPVYRLRLEHGE